MSTTENYEKIAGNIKIETRPFIDGKYVDPIDGQTFEKVNPATGELLLMFLNVMIKMFKRLSTLQENHSILVFGLSVHLKREKRRF